MQPICNQDPVQKALLGLGEFRGKKRVETTSIGRKRGSCLLPVHTTMQREGVRSFETPCNPFLKKVVALGRVSPSAQPLPVTNASPYARRAGGEDSQEGVEAELGQGHRGRDFGKSSAHRSSNPGHPGIGGQCGKNDGAFAW